jgi:hypothetical protein
MREIIRRLFRSDPDNREFKTCTELRRSMQNLKWWGLVALCVTFALAGDAASAQQPKKALRVGYLSSVDPAHEAARTEGIRLALRELGYIDGQNIDFEYRYSEGKSERASEPAAELVRLKVDILLIAGGFPTAEKL